MTTKVSTVSRVTPLNLYSVIPESDPRNQTSLLKLPVTRNTGTV